MPKLIANTKNMDEQEWLQLRKNGIGGSDAAAIAGISKYSSPVLVYMDKSGLYIPEKPERVKMAAEFGNKLEPVVRQTFVEKVNKERYEQGRPGIKVVHRKAIFAHDEHDFIRTNLDGIVYDPELGKGVFEAKTAHYMLREDWDGEDVPNTYLTQCQHNMAVMDMSYSWLAVLIGGNDFRYYFIKRDQEFIDYLIAIEKTFWEKHILRNIPPAMIGHGEEKKMLSSIYPTSIEPELPFILPNESEETLLKLDSAKKNVKTWETEQTRLENVIKDWMKENETAFAGDHKVSWKTSKNGQRRFTYKLKV